MRCFNEEVMKEGFDVGVNFQALIVEQILERVNVVMGSESDNSNIVRVNTFVRIRIRNM